MWLHMITSTCGTQFDHVAVAHVSVPVRRDTASCGSQLDHDVVPSGHFCPCAHSKFEPKLGHGVPCRSFCLTATRRTKLEHGVLATAVRRRRSIKWRELSGCAARPPDTSPGQQGPGAVLLRCPAVLQSSLTVGEEEEEKEKASSIFLFCSHRSHVETWNFFYEPPVLDCLSKCVCVLLRSSS